MNLSGSLRSADKGSRRHVAANIRGSWPAIPQLNNGRPHGRRENTLSIRCIALYRAAAAVEPVHTSQFPGNTVGGHHVRTTRESDHPGFIHTANANWPKFLE